MEKWYAYWDADYGRHYYYNPTTEVTQWVMPDNYVAEDGDSESDRPDYKGSPAVDPSLRKNFSQSISDASGEKEVRLVTAFNVSSMCLLTVLSPLLFVSE